MPPEQLQPMHKDFTGNFLISMVGTCGSTAACQAFLPKLGILRCTCRCRYAY
jgi:hypothetical protein